MKKRVSVYIDEGVWEWTKEKAWEMRISASALFEKLVRGEVAFGNHVTADTAVAWSEKQEKIAVDAVKEKVAKSIGIEAANDRLMAIRKDRGITSLTGHVGALSKTSQVKKGGK